LVGCHFVKFGKFTSLTEVFQQRSQYLIPKSVTLDFLTNLDIFLRNLETSVDQSNLRNYSSGFRSILLNHHILTGYLKSLEAPICAIKKAGRAISGKTREQKSIHALEEENRSQFTHELSHNPP
jgi:hypothetical protein